LSDRHINNIRNFWTKPDDRNPGRRVPMIVDSTHEHARPARVHFQNHAKENLYTLKNHIEYRVKFNEIDYRARTANWSKTLTFPGLSRVGCDQHRRHLSEVLENKANTDIGIDWSGVAVDTAILILGIISTYYLAAYLAVALPVAWQPWSAALSGCGIGFVTGLGAFIKPDTQDHVMYPILGLVNCMGAVAGVYGARSKVPLANASHDLEMAIRTATQNNRPVTNALRRSSSSESFFSAVSDAGEATRRHLTGHLTGP